MQCKITTTEAGASCKKVMLGHQRLPCSSLSLFFPFLLSPSFSLLFPPLRSRPPYCGYGVWGSAISSLTGSGRSQAAKRYLVNFRPKIWPLVQQRFSGAFQEMKHQTGGTEWPSGTSILDFHAGLLVVWGSIPIERYLFVFVACFP